MSSAEPAAAMEETLEQMQARHRKEQRDLQSRITNKKKNATKKTRKGVNDECAELERQLRERQEAELRKLSGVGEPEETPLTDDEDSQLQPPLPQQSQQPQPSEPVVNGLAASLQTTSLSSPPEPSPPPPPSISPQQQQPNPPPAGKKRNRQKERLARRAAEAEAAAEAARSEAAHMTDHRSAERVAMERALARHGLREREVAPDGHCLFSAVADQLAAHGIPLTTTADGEGKGEGEEEKEGDGGGEGKQPLPPPYRVVRAAAADFMRRHRDRYEGFLEEPWDEYLAKIRDTAEWGGQLELSALAGAYGVEIRVVQGGGDRVEVVKPASAEEEEEEGGRKTLWLAYYRHGFGLGEHYNSLRKAS